jgi:hypothetical protein
MNIMEDLKNKNYVAFMSIDYEDGDASTYKGIELSLGDGGVKNFNNGDPLIDWYDYCKYIYNGGANEDGELNNEYLFQNKNGDIDESRPNGESIEGYPFTRYIKGRCY